MSAIWKSQTGVWLSPSIFSASLSPVDTCLLLLSIVRRFSDKLANHSSQTSQTPLAAATSEQWRLKYRTVDMAPCITLFTKILRISGPKKYFFTARTASSSSPEQFEFCLRVKCVLLSGSASILLWMLTGWDAGGAGAGSTLVVVVGMDG